MIKPDTVFVIGAGASVEADLPMGNKLKSIISELTHIAVPDYDLPFYSQNAFYDRLRNTPQFAENPTLLTRAFRQLSAGAPYLASIDSFLEVHKEDENLQQCAKAAIAHAILKAEADSKLKKLGDDKFQPFSGSDLDNTWYLELAHMLFEKTSRDNFKTAFDPVSFIVFNYDRCLEWFIFRALKGLYFLTDEGAQTALRNLKVVHPYGDVGNASWVDNSGPGFGDDADRWCLQSAKRISTFSEGSTKDRSQQAHEWLLKAKTIIFLGISFHPENLALLTPNGASNVNRIIGTRKEISNNAYEDIKARLQRSFSHSGKAGMNINLADTTCADFLRQERRSIVVM